VLVNASSTWPNYRLESDDATNCPASGLLWGGWVTGSFQSRFDPTTTHARSLKRIVIAVAVSLTLAIVGFEIWTAWLGREGQLAETQTKVANLSSLVAEHAERSIEAADIVLRGVIDSVAAGGISAIDVAQQRIVL